MPCATYRIREQSIAEAALNWIAYQNEILQKGIDHHTLSCTVNLLPPDLETLRLMPLYELLEELFSIFGMSRIEKQDAYLFSFFDAVTEYLQSNSSELASFHPLLGRKTLQQNHPQR